MQWTASAMRASRASLDTATHNLANVTSDGFRKLTTRVALGRDGLRTANATSHEQGAIRHTGAPFDLALLGPGAFVVGSGASTRTTRDGAFARDRDGYLVAADGARLHGACGPLRVSADATIAPDGVVHDGGRAIDRLVLPPGTSVQSGAVETSDVDPIGETLAILQAQRAFETAQKVFSAIDATREKSVDDVARVK